MPSSRRTRAILPLLALAAALTGCDLLGPASSIPANAALFSPPREYETWWERTEACSELHGDLRRIEWFSIPQAQEFRTDDGPKVGLWIHSGSGVRIVLAGAYTENELVVRHEMLHALLDREGHPPEYFEQRCHLTWETWGQGG
jgi:hypothetical protein